MERVKVFAPATVANIGPGFDVLGLAVTGLGDIVEANKIDSPEVIIETVSGDDGRLSLDPSKNTAGVAARETLQIIGTATGVVIKLHKGMPLGSGLGSSAASAAAAAWAVALLNDFDDKTAVLPACLAAEAAVSGYHADNVAPSLLGGLVLISGYNPLRINSLPTPSNLHIVLVIPAHEVPTAQARAVVPKMIALDKVVANAGYLSAMIAASFKNDVIAFGRAVVDEIIEPARAHLIPGFQQVKQVALEAGGLGCSISGAGPTVFALADSFAVGQEIGEAMQDAFYKAGLSSVVNIASVDDQGARQI
ncbi:MAG: homoserine kinase [Phycisphaerae bacterium]|nr:homoserine kinase [Phycisphaerae bacterium]NIX28577.1 homoserine kinase [Phycisphaerae bacterium]